LKTVAWPAGAYRAEVKLMRGDQELGRKSLEVTVGQ
jgi:hypothetical protein